ncbi:hypothetical protein ACVBEF_11160 [Glaciimonas sp. GG7]
MRFQKCEKFFGIYLPFVGGVRPAAVEARFPYRVVTLCRTGDTVEVAQLIRQQLCGRVAVQHLDSVPVSNGNLTNIRIEMLCSVSERGDVVRLVTRLGLEKSVRSVRWESIPNKLVS